MVFAPCAIVENRGSIVWCRWVCRNLRRVWVAAFRLLALGYYTKWTLLLAACFSHTLMVSVPSPTVALPIAGFHEPVAGYLAVEFDDFHGVRLLAVFLCT